MIHSTFRKVWQHTPLEFPEFSGLRVMMMPVRLGVFDGVPQQYTQQVAELFGMAESRHQGEVGYLTIDEKDLDSGQTLRRPGKHVDGYYHGRCGAWGGGGGWGSVGNGMLTVSSTPHCRAYPGLFAEEPGPEGQCDHFEIGDGVTFGAGDVYWVDGACVHESLPVSEPTQRQFIRLSMPNNGPWFDSYTPNSSGIKPTGEILTGRNIRPGSNA